MATAVAFVCAGADGVLIPNGRTTSGLSADNRDVPHCPSGGTWQVIEYQPPMDMEALDLEALGLSYTAGFGVLGTGLALVLGARVLLQMIRR